MIVVIMGVSGSGKTTVGKLLAQRLDWAYFEGDEFHSAGNIEKMSKGIALNDGDRLPWLASIKKTIDQCFQCGSNAVVACSALRSRYRCILAANVSEIRFVYLKGDWAIIRQRMAFREGHYMKAGLLESQFDSLEEPDDAIVVDIGNSPQRIVSHIERELNFVTNSY
ncbi:MAG: gluconokinase [Lysobacterales bacterium]|nr:MAG: gluconokinase [Xanthomonadales bacterium]